MIGRTQNLDCLDNFADEQLAKVIREVVRGVKSMSYGSIEIVIQNSRVVQIERKEKFRFDRD